MKTVREIFAEAVPEQVSDILSRLHLKALFEQSMFGDTVSNIKSYVGE